MENNNLGTNSTNNAIDADINTDKLNNETSVELTPEIKIEENQLEEVKKIEKPAPSEEDLLRCKLDTMAHIEMVRKYMKFVNDRIIIRAIEHDKSKLEEDELPYFAAVNSRLKNLTFGSEEYKKNLEDLKPALDHHYNRNSHHPEHYKDGIKDMTLLDIIEMICDWKASSLRQNDGNLLKSIETNAQRFKIDKQLKQILINTAKLFEEN